MRVLKTEGMRLVLATSTSSRRIVLFEQDDELRTKPQLTDDEDALEEPQLQPEEEEMDPG